MQENKIHSADSKEFMEELIRQMDLLPTPASMSAEDGGMAELILEFKKRLKRYYRRCAILTISLDCIICVVLFALAFLIGVSKLTLIAAGVLSVGVVAWTLSRSPLIEI